MCLRRLCPEAFIGYDHEESICFIDIDSGPFSARKLAAQIWKAGDGNSIAYRKW